MASGFEGLPQWAKGIIAVVGTAAVVGIGYKIYSSINYRVTHAGDFKESKDVKSGLSELARKGIKPNFSDAQYSMWANQLFTAMDGYSTDENAIYNVFSKIINEADLLKVIDAYGIRELSSGNWNPDPNFKGTLSGAITNELDSNERAIVNAFLFKKKINFKF